MNKFSIVIPVYNVQNYLKQCIDSVLNQTYKNYEIILVDDGSTDNSGKMCDSFAKKNNNIKVIHKKNEGLSSARNVGIDNANAEYIIFLDSDDFWIDNNALNKFADILNSEKIDVLVFGVKKYYEDIDKYEKIKYKKNMSDLSLMLKHVFFKASATNKIVKHSCIEKNNMKFPIGKLSEDITWCADLINNCTTFYYYDDYVYAYRQRMGSITHSSNAKHIFDILEQCNCAIEKYKKSKKINLIYKFLAYEYCTAIFISTDRNLNTENELIALIKEYSYLLNYGVSFKPFLIKIINKIFGFKFTYKLIGMTYKIKCR